MTARTRRPSAARTIGLPIRELPVDRLIVDYDYQRAQVGSLVRRIAGDYNDALFQPVDAVPRDDDWWALVDGGHRLGAAILMGMTHMMARIHPPMSREQEAELYRRLNSLRRRVTPHEDYHAALFARDPDCVAIDALARKHGFVIAPTNSSNAIRAVGAVRAAFTKHTAPALDKALETMRAAWPGQEAARHDVIVGGLADFYARYPEVDQADAIAKLRRFPADDIVAASHGRALSLGVGTGSRNRPEIASYAVWTIYNQYRRTRLLPNRYNR
jgi:hypothetical protein